MDVELVETPAQVEPDYREPVHAPQPNLNRRILRLIALALGTAAVLALVGVDPAVAGLLLDGELLVLLGGVGVALLVADLRVAVRLVATNRAVVLVRAGAAVTRAHPRSLLTSSW